MMGKAEGRERVASDDRPNSPGQLAVVLFASETTDIFDDQGGEPGPLTLPQIRGAAVGETVHVGLFIHGYTVSDRGLVNLVIDMKVLGPEDQPVVEESDWSRYMDKAPEMPSFLFVRNRLDLTLEPHDPEGDYTILARVRDLVSGRDTTGTYSLYVIQMHEP